MADLTLVFIMECTTACDDFSISYKHRANGQFTSLPGDFRFCQSLSHEFFQIKMFKIRGNEIGHVLFLP